MEVEMLDRFHFDMKNDNNLKNSRKGVMPILKVGLIEKRDFLDFKLTGKFSVLNDQGIPILKGVTAPAKWRLKIENRQQAKYEYSILLEKYFDRTLAEEQEYKLIEKGVGVTIKNLGCKFYLKKKLVSDNTEYWLVVDKLTSEQEANKFAEENFTDFSYQIIKEKLNEPHALLELFDNEFEKLGEAENSIRLVPETPEVITYIYDLTVDTQSQNDPKNYAAFRGIIEFRCLDDGKVAAICEMTIEEYVKNVVALQMLPDLPEEIIKAQAIAVRSKVVSGFGIKHFDDPFDLCSTDHCQPFTGALQIPEIIADAVDETAGLVLSNNKHVVDAKYSAICGGHTESYKNINSDSIIEPYTPVLDSHDQEIFKQYKDLTQSENFKKWVNEEPATYCNLNHLKNNNVPNSLRNNYRWHLTYDREELEEIISEKIGAEIGVLYEIIPVRRGVSGRLQEIEILASNTNLVIKNGSEICRVLSHDRLPSSCFLIECQIDEDGFPISFTFRGAGFGHGVGLCQAGGTAMALNEADYTEILKHYFRGTNLKKIYEV